MTAQNPPVKRSSFSTLLWNFARFREAGISLFIVILIVAVTLRNPAFLTADNFDDIF
jgi:ABC-type glucose/galactose transport system permease subunit